MDDSKLDELHEKVNKLLEGKAKESGKTPEWLHFMFQAALPLALGAIGFYFTNQFNEHQLEFQKISVADNLMNEVLADSNFTKDKLDLKLGFVQKVFDDAKFRDSVKSLLTETYLVNFNDRAPALALKAATGDPTAVASVQKQIAEAKKFNSPSVNNAVEKIENTEPVQRVMKATNLKQKALDDLKNGNVDSAAAKLDQASQLLPKDTATTHLANNIRKNRDGLVKDPELRMNKINQFKYQNAAKTAPVDTSKAVHTPKKKNKQ